MKIKRLKGNLCSEGFNNYFVKWLLIWLKQINKSQEKRKALIVFEVDSEDWLQIGGKIEEYLNEIQQETS